MNLLPKHKYATVDIQKLRDYCLSDTHPIGKHKSRVFKSLLSISLGDEEKLIQLILNGLNSNEAIIGKNDQYGQRYFVDIKITNFDEEVVLRTAWIINETENPRLVTCYIKK